MSNARRRATDLRQWSTAQALRLGYPSLPNLPPRRVRRRRSGANIGSFGAGRPLLLRDVVSPQARLKVLVLGGMHGDELSSTSLVLHWIATRARFRPMCIGASCR